MCLMLETETVTMYHMHSGSSTEISVKQTIDDQVIIVEISGQITKREGQLLIVCIPWK